MRGETKIMIVTYPNGDTKKFRMSKSDFTAVSKFLDLIIDHDEWIDVQEILSNEGRVCFDFYDDDNIETF